MKCLGCLWQVLLSELIDTIFSSFPLRRFKGTSCVLFHMLDREVAHLWLGSPLAGHADDLCGVCGFFSTRSNFNQKFCIPPFCCFNSIRSTDNWFFKAHEVLFFSFFSTPRFVLPFCFVGPDGVAALS